MDRPGRAPRRRPRPARPWARAGRPSEAAASLAPVPPPSEFGAPGPADDVGGTGEAVLVQGLSPFQANELVYWALLLLAAGWAVTRAVRKLVLRYGQGTRWGRRARTRQGLRRARDDLLERHARGELTEAEYRQRLRILEQEGRPGP